MLSLDDATGLPATFGLQLPGDLHRHTARVRWRVATIVGVELVPTSQWRQTNCGGDVMPVCGSIGKRRALDPLRTSAPSHCCPTWDIDPHPITMAMSLSGLRNRVLTSAIIASFVGELVRGGALSHDRAATACVEEPAIEQGVDVVRVHVLDFVLAVTGC